MVIVIGILIGLAAGAGFAFLSLYAFAGSRLAAARRTRQLLISEAKREAETLRREAQIEAREESIRLRADIEREVAERRAEILKIEERVLAKEERPPLLGRAEELLRHGPARRVRQAEEEARAEAKRRARNLVADALQRVAANHASETTVSLIELPSDDMKGRIIGREGRNIRALEHLTGVDVI